LGQRDAQSLDGGLDVVDLEHDLPIAEACSAA
jgi:hypothetical protein